MTKNQAFAKALKSAELRKLQKADITLYPFLEWKARNREFGRQVAKDIASGGDPISLLGRDYHACISLFRIHVDGQTKLVKRDFDDLPADGRPYMEEQARSRHG